MAWNEPGGSNGRDPWGNRKDEQGPPDLDEVVRNLQKKFGGLFGRGGRGADGGGTGGGLGGVGFGGVTLGVLLAVIVWALSGIYIVDEGKRGVVLQFGEYRDTTMPGPHWHPRFIQTIEQVDVEGIRGIDLGLRRDEALMLTQDENIVDLKFAVQYRVKDAKDYLFNVRDPDMTLHQAAQSAVREVVGKSKMDFIITGGRAEIAQQSQVLLQEILDNYRSGLVITSFNMQDAQAPEQVQEAFADAVRAREDEVRLKNEAEAYANDILPKARGHAQRIREESEAYKASVIARAEGQASRFLQVLAEYQKAPEVTRKRLYLDAIESVFAGSKKVVIDAQSGNNMLYLPLDQLPGRSGQPASAAPGTGVAPAGGMAGRFGGDNVARDELRVREDMRRREVR